MARDLGHDSDSTHARPIGGAGGVVFNRRGEVLLIRHRDGSWVFPKGHVDPGETPLEAALREVEEEAGVVATCPDPSFSRRTLYTNARGEARRIVWYRLHTDATTPEMREPLFPEGAFVIPEGALERLSFAEDRALLTYMLATP